MNVSQTLSEQGIESRRFDYDDHTVHVVDFGPGVDATVDVVDETAIIVIGDEQYDIELADNAQVFMSNGVLTIEVRE